MKLHFSLLILLLYPITALSHTVDDLKVGRDIYTVTCYFPPADNEYATAIDWVTPHRVRISNKGTWFEVEEDGIHIDIDISPAVPCMSVREEKQDLVEVEEHGHTPASEIKLGE